MHDFIAWEYFQQNFNVWARKWIDKSNARLGYHMICFRNQQIISKYGKLILFKRYSMLITIKGNVHEIIFSNAQWSEIERESFVNLMLHWTWDVLFGQSTGSSGRLACINYARKTMCYEKKSIKRRKRPILGPEKAIWFLSNYSYFKIAIHIMFILFITHF